MCKGVLPACVSIYYMPAVPVKAKRGHRIPRNWNERWLWAAHGDQTWVLWKSKQQVLLTAESLLQLLLPVILHGNIKDWDALKS